MIICIVTFILGAFFPSFPELEIIGTLESIFLIVLWCHLSQGEQFTETIDGVAQIQ